jgi:uncharacterized sulfatase
MNRLFCVPRCLRTVLAVLLPLLALIALGNPAHAAPPLPSSSFDYALVAQPVAKDVYVLVGKNEYFTPQNGGNVANAGFIVTTAGVVVIDTGPSKRYGEAMRAEVARITPQPVVAVFNTHHHPDHFLGNQAFAGVPLLALPVTVNTIHDDGSLLADNMYRLNGDWMQGTEVRLPNRLFLDKNRDGEKQGWRTVGQHRLELLALTGHSGADLVLIDHSSGVIFAGDLLFHDRAATTPHAHLPHWLAALKVLEQRFATLRATSGQAVLVPGHGQPSNNLRPMTQTAHYLDWLQTRLQHAAASGMDMPELLAEPLPEAFRTLAVIDSEYPRSVGQLFPAQEDAALQQRTLPPVASPHHSHHTEASTGPDPHEHP